MVYNKRGLISIPILIIILMNILLAVIAYQQYLRIQRVLELSKINYHLELIVKSIHNIITIKYLARLNDTITITINIPDNIVVILDKDEVRFYPKLGINLPDPAGIVVYTSKGVVKYKFNITDNTLVLLRGSHVIIVKGFPPKLSE